jgi:FlaA1/EpsC-like NDP-sugar epimerase
MSIPGLLVVERHEAAIRLTLAFAVTGACVGFVLALYLAYLFPGIPRSVLLLEWAGAILFSAGVPFIARVIRKSSLPSATPRGLRTLVVGSRERAEQFLRGTHLRGMDALSVVGLVDLDGAGLGRTTRGVRVVGGIDDLPKVMQRLRAEFAIIALDAADLPQMRHVVDQCIAAALEFKTLPPLHESSEQTAGVNQLRNVRIEDWLGRGPVNLDLSPVSADLRDRVVLLTGAAGSIGSDLARQIAPFGPARLVLLDQSESDLYFAHLELRKAHPDLELVPVICDITHAGRLAQVYAQYRPDYVVHAAAYKHVPLMETNVLEAVRNNVLGTLLVATTAVRYGASKVLLVSTDKAIKPSSVMGATKRVAERIIFGLPNLHRAGTDFRAVRFGNVLASNGSVIPLFERQLAAGGPITVTHPLVERYFMTIREAAQLVLQAGSLPETAGAISMLEMGKPVRILDLAEKLIRFSGRVPGKDIGIVFTGLRPGEKLTEEQVSAVEQTVPTSNEKIHIHQTTESVGPELVQNLSRLFAYLDAGDREGLLATLCELVPECVSPLREHQAKPAARLAPLSSSRVSGPWHAVMDSSHTSWRERRGSGRLAPPVNPHVEERRQGVVCRRKDARAGGRRQTDVALRLPTGSSPTI